MAFKPMLSQIQGGTQLREDVDALQASYLAEKVITTIAKDETNSYNADELLAVLKTGVDGVDKKVADALKTIQDKVVKDVVRIQLTATYGAENSAFTVALPENLDTIVPQVDKTAPVFVYGTDGSSVLGTDGQQITFSLETATFSSVPSELDTENSTEDTLIYTPLTKDFDFKIFPIGSFTLSTLPEDYMLDNSEFQMAAYDKVIDQVVVKLVKDKDLIDAISKLVGSQAVAEQIDAKVNAKAKELTDTITANKTDADDKIEATNTAFADADTALKTELEASIKTVDDGAKARLTAIEAYVTETGLDAQAKIISNVADGALAEDSKEAVNGGQLFAIDAAYKKAVKDLASDVETNYTALSTKVSGYITETGLDANSKVIANVADGTLSDNSKEAVNGSQLNSVKKIADATTTKAAEIETNLNKVKDTIAIPIPIYRTQEVALTEAVQTEIELSATPNDSKVTININGLVYEEDDAFTISRVDPAKLVWTFTAANSGFDLKNDLADKITIHFFEDQSKNVALKDA